MTINIDDYVTIDDTARVAATINMAMVKAAVKIAVFTGFIVFALIIGYIFCYGRRFLACTGINGVPLQLAVAVSVKHILHITMGIQHLRVIITILPYDLPSFRLNLQTAD